MRHVYTENKTEILENYKGALGYELSSTNLLLSFTILLQNSLIIKCYIDKRARFSAAIYIAIAIADIAVAQGCIIVSVAGILVVANIWDVQMLYYCIYYYIATAGLALTCSKVYNAVLITVMTVQFKDPFRRIDYRKIRLCVASLTVALGVLCLCDSLVLLYAEISKKYQKYYEFHLFIHILTNFPGVASLVGLVCEGFDSDLCGNREAIIRPYGNALLGLTFLVDVTLPPLVYIVSAIILVISLRRSTKVHDMGYLMTSDVRHVSTTVVLVAILSFVCNFTTVVIFIVYVVLCGSSGKAFPLSMVKRGCIGGVSEFTLPLLNAALFPVILIKRNPTLRKKFIASSLTVFVDIPRYCWTRFRNIINRYDDDISYDFL